MTDSLLASLAAAVATSPGDSELRVLYASRLVDAGRRDDALGQAMVALSQQPEHEKAAAIVAELTQAHKTTDEAGTGITAEAPTDATTEASIMHTTETPNQIIGYQPHGQGDGPIYARTDAESPQPTVDWKQLEGQFENPMPAPFIAQEAIHNPDGTVDIAVSTAEDSASPAEITRESLTLADVGGLIDVKARIRETFLDPIAHPEIAKAFKKSLGGGLLLYGPPGCGKTYLARAIAGELGASFVSVTLADVLSKWMGESEGNIHKTFAEARQKTPAVLFLDEIDAVGGKRSSQGSQWLRNLVNQLLMELDGVGSDNDGLFVLAATNMPWDVDPALLRPGRFDRMVLVSPPDAPAREAILRSNLEQRPIQGIDLDHLVRHTEGFSGADLKHLCETAAEKALAASIKAGAVQPVAMADLNRALKEVKPSIGPWLDSARNVANYANTDGRYDDLVQLLKSTKRL